MVHISQTTKKKDNFSSDTDGLDRDGSLQIKLIREDKSSDIETHHMHMSNRAIIARRHQKQVEGKRQHGGMIASDIWKLLVTFVAFVASHRNKRFIEYSYSVFWFFLIAQRKSIKAWWKL